MICIQFFVYKIKSSFAGYVIHILSVFLQCENVLFFNTFPNTY